MAAGRYLGDVFFVVNADTSHVRVQADAGVRKAMAGIRPEIPVGVKVDTKAATAALTAFSARAKALSDRLTELRIGANDKAAEYVIARLQVKLATLLKSADFTMTADTRKLDQQILAKIAEVRKLQAQMSGLQADVDIKKAALRLAQLESQAEGLRKQLEDVEPNADTTLITRKLAYVEAQIALVNREASNIDLVAQNVVFLRAIGTAKTELAGLQAQARDIQIGGNTDPVKLLASETALAGIEAAMEKLKPAVAAGDIALGVLGKALVGTGTGWGFLTRSVTLFGGAFNRVLPVVASSVAVWHVVADAIIEIGAVWIPASLAVGAFAVAASDAANEIVRRMTAVHTVMDATGQAVPPLTNKLEQLHKAVQPQVYQLFGDALTIMNSRTGTFQQVAKATGTVLDQLAARITYAVTANNKLGTSTNQLSGFWKTAITDVSKLGDSIGNVFGIFGNLFKAIPGFAAGLLTIGDDFTKILEAASAAAVPVLKWILLLHGYILYSGLAVTATLAFVGAMANLAKQFFTFASGPVIAGVAALRSFASIVVSIATAIATGAVKLYVFATAFRSVAASEGLFTAASLLAQGAAARLGAALAVMNANPMLWVAAAAVALGALVYALSRSKDAAQQFNDTMQQTIANAQLSSVASVIQNAQAQTAAKLTESTHQLSKALAEQGDRTGRASRSWGNETAAVYNATKAHDELVKGMGQLSAQQQLVSSRFGSLTSKYGSSTAALGLLNAAGITGAQITSTQGHAWAEALIQIDSTVQAYKAMGTQAGTLGNDLDVLGRTVTDQYQAVQKLNQGWASFISDVTGTQGSFDTVAQGFSTLSDHSGTLRLSLGKLKVAYKDSNVAIDSLAPAGIALNQAFGDQVTNVDKLFASWRTAGLAGNLFTAGVKDAIAPLTTYANGSQEATAQLVALAQEAGYQGPISMAALTKWLGNTGNATQGLKDITNQATTQEALLTGAMQNQGSFIANQLIGNINSAILAYYNVSKAASDYGKAIAQSGKDSDAAHAAQKILVSDLAKAGTAAGDSAQTIEATLAKVLGVSMPEAVNLFNGAMASTGLAVASATSVIAADFARQKKAADTAGGAVSGYADAIRRNGVASEDARKARQALITDMITAGVRADTAKADVAAYTSAVSKNGIDSGNARKARQQLVTDILAASSNSRQGAKDLSGYNDSLRKNGSDSDATRAARQRLITDLENAGLNAKDATGLVDGLQNAVNNLHGKTVTVIAEASGSGTITIQGSGWATGSGNIRFHSAAGGLIDLGTGPTADDVPAMLSRGEYVIRASSVAKYGKPAMDRLNAGLFAGGGFVGLENSIAASVPAAGQLAGSDAGRAVRAGVSEAIAAARKAVTSKASAAGAPNPAGSGVARWIPTVETVLRMLGLINEPFALLTTLSQMTTESGGNPTIVNRTDSNWLAGTPSVGLMQVIGPTYAANAGPFRNTGPFLYGVSTNGEANIYAGLHYALGRYGNPGWLSVLGHGHGYAEGGPVPGMATGGDPVAAFRSKVTASQAREYHDYLGFRKAELASLHAARPGSYLSGHKTTITGELATLARRQAAEEAAYDAVFHKGATKAVMSHLNTTLKSAMTTTRDKGLAYAGPGGHPGLLNELKGQITALEHIATGKVPAGAITPPRGPKLSQAAFLTRLKSLQSAEYHDYLGLAGAFKAGLRHPAKGSWLYKNRGQLGKDMARLRTLQSAEEAGYDNILHHGTTLPNLSKEIGRVGTELGALRAGELSHLPGGHPGWVKGLAGQLAALDKLLAVQPYNPAWAPHNLGPVHTALPGVEKFDRGGYLRPGLNLAWNGTGKPELVGGGNGDVHLHLHNNGVIGSQAELENWFVRMANHTSRTGKLTQAVRQASR